VLLIALFALAARSTVAPQPGPHTEGGASRSGGASFGLPGDTLHYQVRAGAPLLVSLPEEVRGSEASYQLLHAPALSWLVDRSFAWTTHPSERGILPILIERRPARGALDTLVLLVEVVPGE